MVSSQPMNRYPMCRYLFPLLLALAVVRPAVAADDLARVRRFLTTLESLQGEFVQHATNRATHTTQEAMGSVWIERPARVRWHYTQPAPQDVLIDGERMWVYSAELEQVVVRRLAAGELARTPLAFLAGLASLDDLYAMEALPAAPHPEELRLLLTPKGKDSSFQSVSLRLKRDDLALLGMEVVDTVGNLTAIAFHGLKLNQPVDPAHFALDLPSGTQRIDQ
ncbi:MAG TPA: outer membrane lipoprotein carrier protein LolA [Proteobacteria bacterium]|nr:outer membrane lipoprotein carrier protein LolA [Pseudomonadota bacterium]